MTVPQMRHDRDIRGLVWERDGLFLRAAYGSYFEVFDLRGGELLDCADIGYFPAAVRARVERGLAEYRQAFSAEGAGVVAAAPSER